MMERVRVGVINTSWYADTLHLPSLKSHPQADIAAICGRNRDRAGELAGKFQIPQVYSDYRAMIEKAKLDAVLVAAPDDLHFSMTMAALDAGLHVLCEKPLALTVEQAQQMTDKAEASGLKNMVFFTFRWLQHTRHLKELLQAGYIGQCRHCQVSYVTGSGFSGEYRWRFDGDRAHGILGDLGSHLIDLALWLNGDIARVSALLTNYVQRKHADGRPVTTVNDAALLQVEFANGAQGLIHTSAVAHTAERALEQHIILYGSEGSLEADFVFGNFGGTGEGMAVRGARRGDSRFQALPIPEAIWEGVDPAQPLEVFNRSSAGTRYFVDCILADRMPEPSFRAGLMVQKVIAAAIQSQQTGQWVKLEPV
jgi:predicted dehydrogenase